jgi:hypothetical protein
MTDPEHDEAFEAYLKRRSVLPHAVDDRLEPPAALDQFVLNEARDAIKSQGARDRAAGTTADTRTLAGGPAADLPAAKKRMDRAPRWAVPVALAATVLLCLSIVMNISLNTNRPSPNLERMTAARADYKAGVTADARGSAGTVNHSERRESVSGDIPSNEVILPEAKVAGSPAPHAPVQAESALAPPDTSTSNTRSTNSVARAASAKTPAASASADEEPRVAAKSAADKAVLFAKRAGTSPPGSAPVAGSAAVPNSADASSAAADAFQAPSTGGPGTAGPKATPPHPADPRVWLQHIDALRAAGKTGQADAEMQRLRAAFPGYVAKPPTPTSAAAPK